MATSKLAGSNWGTCPPHKPGRLRGLIALTRVDEEWPTATCGAELPPGQCSSTDFKETDPNEQLSSSMAFHENNLGDRARVAQRNPLGSTGNPFPPMFEIPPVIPNIRRQCDLSMPMNTPQSNTPLLRLLGPVLSRQASELLFITGKFKRTPRVAQQKGLQRRTPR